MDYRILVFKIRELLYRLIGKDTVCILIEKYRYKGMKIGNNCRIFSALTTPEPYLVEIGDNVTIATSVHLITHDNSAIKLFSDGTDFVGKIKIGNNCFIGSGTIILPGVSIADNTIVGAGTLLCKSIQNEGCIVAGNPGKIIGTIESLKEKNSNKIFNFKGLSSDEKKKLIMDNPEKYLVK